MLLLKILRYKNFQKDPKNLFIDRISQSYAL